MTDANLMDADCIHSNVWWECREVECQFGPEEDDELFYIDPYGDTP